MGRTHLVSPQMTAAIAGRFVDIRKWSKNRGG